MSPPPSVFTGATGGMVGTTATIPDGTAVGILPSIILIPTTGVSTDVVVAVATATTWVVTMPTMMGMEWGITMVETASIADAIIRAHLQSPPNRALPAEMVPTFATATCEAICAAAIADVMAATWQHVVATVLAAVTDRAVL